MTHATFGCRARCLADWQYELAIANPKGGHTINNAQNFLDDARKSFCLAAKATGMKETERYAAMGRDYLHLAHEAARLSEAPPAVSSWK